jgi:ligand-binding sensor domain-containing protein/class 3 adenylate cyclase
MNRIPPIVLVLLLFASALVARRAQAQEPPSDLTPGGRETFAVTAEPATTASWGLDPNKAITQYMHDVWSARDGLPQQTVRSITQTRDGYLWLGTDEGLARFDGIRFKIFDPSSAPEMKNPNIRCVVEDREGSLWVGAREGGLMRLRRGEWRRFTAKDGLSDEWIHALTEGRDGSLWIGTFRGGLYRLKDDHFTEYRKKDGLPERPLGPLLEDVSGTLWIGTRGAGLYRFRDGRFSGITSKDGLPNDFVSALHEGADGSLWIGTEGGLARMREGSITVLKAEDGLSNNRVRALLEDREGSLWIGTDGGGLTRFRAGRFSVYSKKDGLSDDSVIALAEDREGSLWIGTFSGGLNRLANTRVTVHAAREGLAGDAVMAVLAARDGAVWAASWRQGLNRLAKGELSIFTKKDGLPSDGIATLLEDREGGLWLGAYEGLWRMKDGGFTHYPLLPDGSRVLVAGLVFDRAGGLWVSSDVGVFRRREDGGFTRYTTADGLANNRCYGIAEDKSGAVWVATAGGLSRFEAGKITSITTDAGLSSNLVHALYPDEDGTLWIGTKGGGLNRLRSGVITAFTIREGLFDNTVYWILDDGQGRLWMTCNKGVFSVTKRELEDVADGRIERLNPVAYGMDDGMRSRECNGGHPGGQQTKDGRLWFPTLEGIAVIDPVYSYENTIPPPVVIERVVADGEVTEAALSGEACPGGPCLSLRPGLEKLEIDYTGLSLVAPRRVRFKYRLEGFERGWSDVGGRRTAYYTNLPPGDYVFRVAASNNDGVWNETGASIAIRLEPFFYQTAPFKGLLGLMLVVAGYGAYRLRILRLKARARSLTRLVRERTRELAAEHARAEELLLNVLPAPVAQRLKRESGAIADDFPEVSILFCDIVDFTSLSANRSARELVDLLNGVFTAFDKLAEKLGLEKIKTIGDAYMVAGGLPTPRPDHAEAVAAMALEMREAIKAWNEERGASLTIRIGIHTGPAVAGVIGIKKFIYDIWGDAVNTASRMESHGLPGEIQVSEETYQRIRDRFDLKKRGVIRVKGKGEMCTYFLVGPRESRTEQACVA